MTKIVCIGDAMMDVIVKMKSPVNQDSDTLSEISMLGGGAAANTSAWLASLGIDTTFIGRIGSDLAGASFHDELLAYGVKHPNPPISDKKTGTVVVLVDSAGNRTMFPDPGANSGLDERDLPALDGFTGAFLSGYSLFNPASSEGVQRIISNLSKAGIPIYFDLASVGTISAFGFDRAHSLLKGFAGLFLNEEEVIFITKKNELHAAIIELSKLAPLVVIKRGSNGALAWTQSNSTIERPAIKVNVVDTTGADRKSTRLNSSHVSESRMPSSA